MRRRVAFAMVLGVAACLLADSPVAPGKATGPEGKSGVSPVYAKERLVLLSFDNPTPPQNGDGEGYPHNGSYNPQRKEGGKATCSIEDTDAIAGSSLRIQLTEGKLYLQFNPYNYTGKPSYPPGPRAFARQYAPNAADWKFNTYNRMRFWIKVPTNGSGHRTNGSHNVEFGTYVKRVTNPDRYSDEAGGTHYYHQLNLPALGEWTQVILNMHPDHRRGSGGNVDPGVLAHPTGEDQYNYFDSLTRFYLQYPYVAPKKYPASFLLDEMEFYQEPAQENDAQVYSLTATYRGIRNRLLVTWNRKIAEGNIKHEVRYAFADIHTIGWKAAKPAPLGLITPPADGGYNNMVYDTTQLPLAKRAAVYIAIKPQNSNRFSQIVVPLFRKKAPS